MAVRRFVSRLVLGVAVAALAVPEVAFAQAAPPPEPVAQESAPAPAPAPVPPADAADAADVQADYDRAFDLLVAGQYAAAAALFDSVGQRTHDPSRLAAARELARLAHRMAEKHGGAVAPGTGAAAPAVRFDDGRAEFVVATTLATFYSGFFLTDIFDVSSFRAQTVVVAGVTAAGFAGSILGTQGRRVPGSMAEAYTLGLWTGLANGLLLAPALGISADGGPDDGSVNENYTTFGLVTMSLGGVAGAYLGHEVEPTRGQVRLAGTLGLSGAATTGLMLAIIQPEDLSGKTVAALIAGGLDVGVGAGAWLAPHVDWSTSRTSLVGLSEFLGALGGFTVAALAFGSDGPQSDNEGRVAAGTVLVGLWSGFGLGAYFTRHMAPDVRFESKSAPPPARAARAHWQLVPVLGGRAPGLAVVGAF